MVDSVGGSTPPPISGKPTPKPTDGGKKDFWSTYQPPKGMMDSKLGQQLGKSGMVKYIHTLMNNVVSQVKKDEAKARKVARETKNLLLYGHR